MNKLTYIMIGMCMVIMQFSYAQNNDTDIKDPKAKKVLEDVSKKSKSYQSVSINFSYGIENKSEGISDSQDGNIKLKGQKYKLKIAGQEVTSNGTTVWNYIEDADEVQISNISEDDEDNLMNPANIFSIHEKGFKYRYMNEDSKFHFIDLYPIKASEKPFHTIKLKVDKASLQMKTITVLSKDGNIYTYTLKEFDTNGNFADDFFNFDTSKVDEVIDLRD